MSVAIARPCSSRKARATASRARSSASSRTGRHIDPVVSQIGRTSTLPCFAPGIRAAASIASSRSRRLDQVVPAEVLLGLGERPVGDDPLPVAELTVVASVRPGAPRRPRTGRVSRSHAEYAP